MRNYLLAGLTALVLSSNSFANIVPPETESCPLRAFGVPSALISYVETHGAQEIQQGSDETSCTVYSLELKYRDAPVQVEVGECTPAGAFIAAESEDFSFLLLRANTSQGPGYIVTGGSQVDGVRYCSDGQVNFDTFTRTMSIVERLNLDSEEVLLQSD